MQRYTRLVEFEDLPIQAGFQPMGLPTKMDDYQWQKVDTFQFIVRAPGDTTGRHIYDVRHDEMFGRNEKTVVLA